MDGAGGGLDERGLFVRDVVDLEDFASVATRAWKAVRQLFNVSIRQRPGHEGEVKHLQGDILAEAARDVHPVAFEVLTEHELGTTAEEAVAALQQEAVSDVMVPTSD